ncbi:TAP-like protein [Aspergillus sclerotialis]|uniref:TAP-like protein n=1 Tax=Aspergillus sclerotialis TaxID=2070753 RepID=A0A3A2ZJD7_9EURO|nr:TAP-like protein [Aspergillus sclerotialis]
MAEIKFNPNIHLKSTYYQVPGYESDIHALVSPIPPIPQRTVPKPTTTFSHEQFLQHEAYHSRPPVILVHGMVVASTYMHDLGRHLAPWFRVFIPDLPGFGLSATALPKRAKVSIPQLAKGLLDFMNTAGIQKAHFISNSMGCQVLAEFTTHWPDRVDRLVLQGPTIDKSRRSAARTLIAQLANGRNEPFSMNFIMAKDYWRAGLRRAFTLFRETLEYRVQDVLSALDHHMLLLSCEFDPVTPVVWVAELADLIPNAVHYVLTNAAHTANYSATEKMSRVVLRFLLVRDDERIRRAGRELVEEVLRINRSREEAESLRGKLLWMQAALGLVAGISAWKGIISRLEFLGLASIQLVVVYKHYLIRPLVSLNRSKHLDSVYISLEGIADFDSASSMLRAVGRHLHFRDFPKLGISTSLTRAMPLVNFLPHPLRNTVYSTVGAAESQKDLSTFDAETVATATVNHFPAYRKYPAIAIGSTNGALTHLYTAMGIPWLPQTFLVPVTRPKRAAIRHGVLDMSAEMEWGRSAARSLLDRNPGLELYHMADPNQDQLMVARMAYFRVKFVTLPAAYTKFLVEALDSGGTILVARCGLKWPGTVVGERHYFQAGAVGGITAGEYIDGSNAVRGTVESQKSALGGIHEKVLGQEQRTNWNAPAPNCDIPEAEWGYSDGLTDDIIEFAKQHGFQIKYIDYDHPETASPVVADLYTQWREQLRTPTSSLLVENFIVMEPWLAIRYNLIPFWTVFPVKPSLEKLQEYLRLHRERGKPFQDGFLFLFCSGVDSIGLAGVDEWRGVLDCHFAARDKGLEGRVGEGRTRVRVLGIDERKFPKDFGFPALYQSHLVGAVGEEGQHVMPPDLGSDVFEEFMVRNAGRYGVYYRG